MKNIFNEIKNKDIVFGGNENLILTLSKYVAKKDDAYVSMLVKIMELHVEEITKRLIANLPDKNILKEGFLPFEIKMAQKRIYMGKKLKIPMWIIFDMAKERQCAVENTVNKIKNGETDNIPESLLHSAQERIDFQNEVNYHRP